MFLNGKLEEEIYMMEPPGFVILGQEHKECWLRKFLYELRQTSLNWFEKFHETIIGFGFVSNRSDKCVNSKLFGKDYMPIHG